MASERINKKDLFGKLDLKAEIKAMKELLEVIKDFQEEVKELAKNKVGDVIGIDVATIKGVKDLNEAKKQAIELEKQETELKKQEKKVKKQLKDLTDAELTQKIKQQQVDAQRKKDIKDQIALTEKEGTTLTKILARNRQLRKIRADLNLETEEGKKQVKKINKELDENNKIITENADKLKKQKMNVGNYAGALEGLEKITGGVSGKLQGMLEVLKQQKEALDNMGDSADEAGEKTKKFGKTAKALGIGALIAVLGVVAGSFGDSRKEADQMATMMERLQGQIKVIGGAIFDLAVGAFGELQIGLKNMSISWLEFTNVLGKNDEEIAKLKGEIIEVESEISGWTNSMDGLGKKMGDMDDNTSSLRENIRRFNEEILFSDQRLIGYRKQLELLETQSGDNTRSFNEQAEAQGKINAVLDKIEKENQERADLKRGILLQKVNQDLIKIKKELTEEDLKNLDVLKQKDIADNLNQDTLDEFVQTVTEVREAEIELQQQREAVAKEERETTRDRFERNLDFAIDAFDAQKTLNERILSDERTTLAEREAITEATKDLAEGSFASQQELLQKQVGDQVDVADLLASKDEEALRAKIEGYNADDIELGRLLEVYRERLAVQQDIVDMEKDNVKIKLENNKAIAESDEAIREDNLALEIELAEQKLALDKEISTVRLAEEKKRLDAILEKKKKNLDEEEAFQIAQAKAEIIEKEVLDAKIIEIETLTANEKKRLAQEVTDEKIRLEREAKLETIKQAQETFSKVSEIWNESLDKRSEVLDQQFQDSKKQEQNLQLLAMQGVDLAEGALASEQKIQAEIQAEQAKVAKKRQLIKATETALELMGSYAEGGSKQPFKDAFGDLTKMFGALKGLKFFNEGTDSVGGVDRGYDSQLAMLRPTERVMTVDQNKMMGNISNDEVASVIQAYNQGAFSSSIVPVGVSQEAVKGENDEVVKRLESVEKAIKNIPVASFDAHSVADHLSETIKTQNRIDRNHYKPNQIFK